MDHTNREVEVEILKMKIKKLELENYYLRKESLIRKEKVNPYLSIYEPPVMTLSDDKYVTLKIGVDVKFEKEDSLYYHVTTKCNTKEGTFGYRYMIDRIEMLDSVHAMNLCEEFHKNLIKTYADFYLNDPGFKKLRLNK